MKKRKAEELKKQIDKKSPKNLKKTLELVEKFPPKTDSFKKRKGYVWILA